MESKAVLRIALFLLVSQVLLVCCNTETVPHLPFPSVDPESVGVSPDSLRVIADQVDTWVDSGEIVGAETLIIKQKGTVLHEASGWMNLEHEVPMKKNTIFNIRSMTKPLVGTAVFMLRERGHLSLDDRVLEYIPAFDNDKCRDITIDHLLMHTAGFSGSRETHAGHGSLEEIIKESSETGPLYEPGSRFHYSGRNSAVLAFVIESITGTPAETWIRANILDPLDMRETFCIHHPLRSDTLLNRVSHAYALGDGGYEKHRDPSWEPEFPYFGGGVGFYSTVLDYARFLSMWMGAGGLEDGRFPGPSTLRLAFQASSFDPTYARHWDIFSRASGNEEDRPAFGHIGDYGTMAYAVPESDMIICFFTQSRHNRIMGKFLELAERTLY